MLTNLIFAFFLTAVPDCNAPIVWYAPDGHTNGSGLHACHNFTLGFHSALGSTYRVKYKAFDATSKLWGVWNICTPPITGTGGDLYVTTGAPEPFAALYTLDISPPPTFTLERAAPRSIVTANRPCYGCKGF